MFCPKCGNNCGSSDFCIKCGTRIGAGGGSPAWAPGMACPYCGGLELEGKNCAYCGRLLVANQPPKHSGSSFGSYSQLISEAQDLTYYYQRYKDDKEAALRALRIDTGMGPVDAKKQIDLIFSHFEGNS